MNADKKANIARALAEWQHGKPSGIRSYKLHARGHSDVTGHLMEVCGWNRIVKRIYFSECYEPLTPERIKALIDDPLGDA